MTGHAAHPPERRSRTGLGPVSLLPTAIGSPTDPADRLRLSGDQLPDRPARSREPGRSASHLNDDLRLARRTGAASREARWRPAHRAVPLATVPHPPRLDAAPPATGRAWPTHDDVLLFPGGGQQPRLPRPPDQPAAAGAPTAAANRAA